ncbi:Histone chaperone [Pseudocercospora fuligena]|uniref:Histone chaperone n=1 Tax=Pseudocercospora fuligena TaxID=685502 RepID=A0A8H6RP66_9PEZI|nr:Histone chaperone [Pseudocercospora fuligena]
MAGQQWAQDVQTAFRTDSALATRIIDAANRHQGELPALFWDIAKHVIASSTGSSSSAAQATNTKKRKLDEATSSNHQPTANGNSNHSTPIAQPALAFECKNVSFAVPARKKLKLQIIADQSEPSRREVRLLNNTTNETEYTLPNAQIDQVFCLPVPEKQQRQSNFVILPKAGATNADGTPCEQIVFTMNETKPDDANSSTRAKVEGDTYITVTDAELNALLQPYGKQVIRPTEAEFASSIPQSHRKGEKGYHVKAHRGTKEGYLFFLPLGVLFGFKKPLSFFPFSTIESISYTSVLQRTFNLVISATTTSSSEEAAQDVEFSMLDQADFAGIDEYIKRHQLNDASMAAARRAKEFNVNKDKKKEGGGGAEGGRDGGVGDGDGVGEDGLTDLQRAEQELQDAEDEEEEDYVESGGESDGEGEDSDEEEEDGGEGEGEEYDEEEEGEEE